uniref:Uncharacterized protein n=1 Tax=Setaria viridis TaxID=4556 RepID=A0A4U6TAR5_SETVI|nr:hypothetical protein SEVIR_8G016200v2 [Setaria viridis]
MEPGLVGAYSVFLCFAAIKSEPETDCYKKGKAGVNWKTLISFVAELIGTTYAVFSTGKDYKCIQFRNVVESEDDVPYGYGFFHFVFAMGSMYFGMLFVGWDTHHIMEKWSIDVSWTSAWVHIVNEGLAVISFVAILLARIYGIGWLRQLLARIFGIGDQHQHQHQPPPHEMNTAAAAAAAAARAGAPPSPPLSQRTEEIDDDMVQSIIDSIDHGPQPSPVEEQGIMSADTTVVLGRNMNRSRNRNDDAAGASSSSAAPAAAAAGGGRRMPTRKGMFFCLCLQGTLICFASLYYMLYTQRPIQ